MTEVTRLVDAPPAEVFATLADGWTYPLWVVGAAHMRAVDPAFPAVGSKLHHSVGLWPLLIEDTTEVVEMEPDRFGSLRHGQHRSNQGTHLGWQCGGAHL